MKVYKQPNNLYIKFWRNNIFLNLTTFSGILLFKCSCGYIKSHQQKNLISAFIYLIKYMRITAKFKGNFSVNLILEGALNSTQIDLIYTQLLKWQFKVRFVKLIDKIPHNGCRAKVKRYKRRKRYYRG